MQHKQFSNVRKRKRNRFGEKEEDLVIYVHCLGCCVKLIGCPLCGEFKI
jgi:hypothetical protein